MADMMKSIKSKNCIEGFKKILKMSRFCGIMPLDEQCHLRLMFILVSTTLFIFQLVFVASWFSLYYNGLIKRDINTFLTFFRMCCCIVSVFLISYQFSLKREELRAAMWSLTTIDKALFAANLPWEWSIHPFMSVGNLIMVMVPFTLHIIWRSPQLGQWLIIFYFNLVLMIICINQFCSFLNFMQYCLKQINYSKGPEYYPKLYSVIEHFCLILNDVYGQGIICIIVALYLGVLHHLYSFFSSQDIPFYQNWNSIAIATSYIMILLQIISTCQKLSVEVTKFNMCLYKEQKQSRQLLNCEELKFHFETKEEFKFTAHYFFTVDVSLIGSMILSGTTYLVTLLQFTPNGIHKS